MKMYDLEHGMVVETKRGKDRLLLYTDYGFIDIINNIPLNAYNQSLNHLQNDQWTIVAIYQIKDGFVLEHLQTGDYLNLIWRRPTFSLSTAEINTLELLSDEYNYIARDKDNNLWLSLEEPIFTNGFLSTLRDNTFVLIEAFNHVFKDIKKGEWYAIQDII